MSLNATRSMFWKAITEVEEQIAVTQDSVQDGNAADAVKDLTRLIDALAEAKSRTVALRDKTKDLLRS